MENVSNVLMMDGGWGFAIASVPARHRLWIKFESEGEAIVARATIGEVLQTAIAITDASCIQKDDEFIPVHE